MSAVCAKCGGAVSKTCSKCGERKCLCEFHKDKTKPDGHTLQCAECKREQAREYRELPGRREHIRKYGREYAQRPHRKAKRKATQVIGSYCIDCGEVRAVKVKGRCRLCHNVYIRKLAADKNKPIISGSMVTYQMVYDVIKAVKHRHKRGIKKGKFINNGASVVSCEYLINLFKQCGGRSQYLGKIMGPIGHSVGAIPPETMSLDRINNDYGYIEGNIRWVTYQENVEQRNWPKSKKMRIPKKTRDAIAKYEDLGKQQKSLFMR